MNREEESEQRSPVVRDLIAQFVEEAGADAVLVLWTVSDKRKTSVKMSSFGNQLACRAMLDSAIERYDDQEDDEDDDD